MGKRGNGEGSITRRKSDGLYMARYTVQTATGAKRKTLYEDHARGGLGQAHEGDGESGRRTGLRERGADAGGVLGPLVRGTTISGTRVPRCYSPAANHPKLVQELLGHASVALTLDRYSHVLPGKGDQTAAAMEAALS